MSKVGEFQLPNFSGGNANVNLKKETAFLKTKRNKLLTEICEIIFGRDLLFFGWGTKKQQISTKKYFTNISQNWGGGQIWVERGEGGISGTLKKNSIS